MTKRRPPDSRLAAARYAIERDVPDDEDPSDRGQISPDQRAQAVEIAIQEARVREVLDDFNHRVREARRQLLGGPPVITRPRDVEAELAAWRTRALERRAARERAQAEEREREAAALAAMTWRERRRAKRRR